MKELKAKPPPGFHTFLQGILDANIPIGWIVNRNVKELILLSQADPKRRDQSSPSTLDESKTKKLTKKDCKHSRILRLHQNPKKRR
ncbi:hypothetical protein AVEN_210242-1 [Araneus ventricosus]|uniref:Uncharacterized protein n=1 Tax=Araneus ventricosus TaxID=182803 RepID=A0A4Y2FYM6_ARAVE|nr:hypothetical protein AVEN_210242-1 [Araneus ventricosus]